LVRLVRQRLSGRISLTLASPMRPCFIAGAPA